MSKKKILIIDDEKDLVKALSIRLESEKYDVDFSFDGFDGLNKARTVRPDLIILDLMLPKISGFKISRLLKFDDNYKHIPIIMLTARTEKEDEELGKKTGCDMYFTKPHNDEELLKAVSMLVNS